MAQVTLLPGEIVFDMVTGKTVLESAEIAKVPLPFGCRAGACGACFVYVLKGLDGLPEPMRIEIDTLRKRSKVGEGRLACRIKDFPDDITIQKRS